MPPSTHLERQLSEHPCPPGPSRLLLGASPEHPAHPSSRACPVTGSFILLGLGSVPPQTALCPQHPARARHRGGAQEDWFNERADELTNNPLLGREDSAKRGVYERSQKRGQGRRRRSWRESRAGEEGLGGGR